MKQTASIDKALERLIDGMAPDLHRLQQQALLLGKSDAAKELLRRADEVLQYFGPVLMEAPHLLAGVAPVRVDIPTPIALSRSHRYYYKRVIDRLHRLKLGSKTGIACHKRANWKGTNSIGEWAVLLYNIVEVLRTKSTAPEKTTQAVVLWVKDNQPSIAETASRLSKFGADSVDIWIRDACCPILYVLRPELRPAKRGNRKRTDEQRADPRAKRERDAIIQRIRSMVAGRNKSRSFKSRI